MPISFSLESIVVPQGMSPFFGSFSPPITDQDIQRQMIKFLLEDISRMIARSLRKSRETLGHSEW